MIILDNAPCNISLNTHGGADIDFGFVRICSCLGGWAFILKSDTHANENLYINIASAYIAAAREFNSKFSGAIPILKTEQGEVVDQW